jgi:hypothetical protein
VRRIVAADLSALNRRDSRHENHRTPLHFAVLKHRPAMVALLLELGADPLAVDGGGQPVAMYATSPEIDRPVMERIRAMTLAEFTSADRGRRTARGDAMDLLAMLALGDVAGAARVLRDNPSSIAPERGVLHIMTKRDDRAAIEWLLAHGADVNGMWAHWDARVTPLHLAARAGHVEAARLLLAAGADASIRDSQHQADPLGWAEFFQQPAVAALLRRGR